VGRVTPAAAAAKYFVCYSSSKVHQQYSAKAIGSGVWRDVSAGTNLCQAVGLAKPAAAAAK
jgi:hypothetical protein